MRYKRTRTDAALPQPRSPHFVIFTGIPKAPASLDDVHRTRKRPQTPLDTRTQRPRPSSISARQSVSAPSTGRLSRAHKPRGDWRGGLGETRKPRISPRCQPHRSIDAPAFTPAVAMSRHFSERSTQAKALFLKFHSGNSALTPKGHTKSRFDARHSSRRPSARRPLPSPRRDGYFSLRRDKRTSSSSRAFSPARSAQRNGACQGLEYTPSRYRAAERWCARIMFSGLFRQLAP